MFTLLKLCSETVIILSCVTGACAVRACRLAVVFGSLTTHIEVIKFACQRGVSTHCEEVFPFVVCYFPLVPATCPWCLIGEIGTPLCLCITS